MIEKREYLKKQKDMRQTWQNMLSEFKTKPGDDDYGTEWVEKRRKLYSDCRNSLSPANYEDVQRLASLRNRYKGERIFIMGNGPSLNQTPLEHFADEYTFGVNRIYLMFDRIQWRPSFFTVIDWRVAGDCYQEINALTDMMFFFPEHLRGLLTEREDVYWFWNQGAHSWRNFSGEHVFSPDLTRGARFPQTVAGSAIQIAYHLGFDPIYLVGVDVSYKVLSTVKQSGPDLFKNGALLNLQSTVDDDPNHFDPRYFGKDRMWTSPNVEGMIETFRQCREGIESRGRHIYNATVGGKLEVLERVDIHSLFPKQIAVPDFIKPARKNDDTDIHILSKSYSRAQHATINESTLIHKLLATKPCNSILIDVGACSGSVSLPFVMDGWDVFAFEPNSSARKNMNNRITDTLLKLAREESDFALEMNRTDGDQLYVKMKHNVLLGQPETRFVIDARAVSNEVAEEQVFYTSPDSIGVSTLKPFLSSHAAQDIVSVTTLREFCAEYQITHVDFLKIDAEGYDYKVLLGFPWEIMHPDVIECEFENNKTLPLGYNTYEMAQFLVDKGYTVYISEWHPIISYGIRHDWCRWTRFPSELKSLDAWGNLIAFKNPPDDETLRAALADFVELIPETITSKSKVMTSPPMEKLVFQPKTRTSKVLDRIRPYAARVPFLKLIYKRLAPKILKRFKKLYQFYFGKRLAFVLLLIIALGLLLITEGFDWLWIGTIVAIFLALFGLAVGTAFESIDQVLTRVRQLEPLSGRLGTVQSKLRQITEQINAQDAQLVELHAQVAGVQMLQAQQAEGRQEREARTELYSQAINHDDRGIFILGSDNRILDANQQFIRIVGRSMSEIIGSSIETWFENKASHAAIARVRDGHTETAQLSVQIGAKSFKLNLYTAPSQASPKGLTGIISLDEPFEYSYRNSPHPRPASTTSLPEVFHWFFPEATPLPVQPGIINPVAFKCRNNPDYFGSVGKTGATEQDTADAIYTLVRMLDPKNAIEVGTYNAAASITIAQALADNGGHGQLHTVEISPDNYRLAETHIKEAGFGHLVQQYHGSSQDLSICHALPQSEFIFIDGDHTYDGAKKDFETYIKLLTDKGIMLFHDTIKIMELSRLMSEIAAMLDYAVFTVATSDGDGFTLIRRRENANRL